MALQVLYSTVWCISLPVVWSAKFELVCHVIVWELSFKSVFKRIEVENGVSKMHPGASMYWSWIARNLNVDPSTVYRTVQLFEETGTVCSIQGYHESPFKKLTPHDEFAILDVVLDQPSTYLKDVHQHLLQTTGTDVYIATLCMYQDLHERSWH